jgi:hypothetical protein
MTPVVISDCSFCRDVTNAANILRNYFTVDEDHGVNEHKDALRIAGDEPVADEQFGAAILAFKHAEREIRSRIDHPERNVIPTEIYEAHYRLVREILTAIRTKVEAIKHEAQ